MDRNRAKRRLRAVMRAIDLPEATDLVVLARAGAVSCCFEELATDVATSVARVHGGARTEP